MRSHRPGQASAVPLAPFGRPQGGGPARYLASLWAFLALGCADSSMPPLPQPVLDGFAPAVQAQLKAARARADDYPDQASAVGQMGRILYAYGQFRAARDCFLRCRGLDPDRFEWAYLLGVVESGLGRFVEARAAFEAAAAMRPVDLPTALRLADLLEHSGGHAGSRVILEDVLRRSSGTAAAHYRLGRLAAAEGSSEAIDHFEAALEIGNCSPRPVGSMD